MSEIETRVRNEIWMNFVSVMGKQPLSCQEWEEYLLRLYAKYDTTVNILTK